MYFCLQITDAYSVIFVSLDEKEQLYFVLLNKYLDENTYGSK